MKDVLDFMERSTSELMEKISQDAPRPQGLFGALMVCLAACTCFGSTVNWPQFRGPGASGVSEDAAPVTWNVESGENIKWQAPIPGLGHACPIIWQDRIYIATAVKPGSKPDLKIGLYGDIDSYTEKETHQWRLLCLAKSSGKVVWNNLVLETVPRTQRHTKATHCNSTPVTDGKRLVAILGSEGLFCFDLDGRQLWRKDLGRMDPGYYVVTNTSWGFGSSPVLYDGKVVIQCDVLSEQFLAVFDAKDGRELWRTARSEVPTWWNAPDLQARSHRLDSPSAFRHCPGNAGFIRQASGDFARPAA